MWCLSRESVPLQFKRDKLDVVASNEVDRSRSSNSSEMLHSRLPDDAHEEDNRSIVGLLVLNESEKEEVMNSESEEYFDSLSDDTHEYSDSETDSDSEILEDMKTENLLCISAVHNI